MGILNDVLAYKERKEQQKRASLDAIPQAMAQFQAGQQQAFNNALNVMKLRATLSSLNGMKGVWTVDPLTGQLKSSGSVPFRDRVIQAPLTPEQVGQRSEASSAGSARGTLDAPTAEIKNQYSQILEAQKSINNLKELADKVGTSGWKGVVDMQTGKITRGESNPELMQYLKELNASAVSIYRAKTGDTRLSDADALARAIPLLWNPSEGEKVKELSFSRLNDVFDIRKKSYEDRYGFSGDSVTERNVKPMPKKSDAPKGAKGWNSETGEWVF